jgi:hypothetical protein
MVEHCPAWGNLYVLRVDALGQHRLIREAHNAILQAGMAELVAGGDGGIVQTNCFGLGSSGTAVNQATDTWLLTPELVTAPTSIYYDGPLCRATMYLDQSQLNGVTIREAILAPTTTAPGSGGSPAYTRVTFPGIAKTASYSYLFLYDCTWGV